MPQLTVQKLANLCNHSWELQREVGFHLQSPKNFRDYLTGLSDKDLLPIMENLGLLMRTVEEIGGARIDLTPAPPMEIPGKLEV
jgi:hypothetical protein